MIWLLPISPVSSLIPHLLCSLIILNYLHFPPYTMLFLLTEMTSPNSFPWVTPTHLSGSGLGMTFPQSLPLTSHHLASFQFTLFSEHSGLISIILVVTIYYHFFVLLPLPQMWTPKRQEPYQIHICLLAHRRCSKIFVLWIEETKGDYHRSLMINTLYLALGYHFKVWSQPLLRYTYRPVRIEII